MLTLRKDYKFGHMKKLLSLPPNLVECFHDVEQANRKEWFCTSDPIGHKLGSGGGTAWLLQSCRKNEGLQNESWKDWLSHEKRILLHAGGQSRRLPAYAPSGKILTPIPVFRWKRGQRINQNLLDLQLPLYEQIMERAPQSLHTLIASGDVYIRTDKPLQDIPDADVVCYGLWADPSLAKNHGVFVSDRRTPDRLAFMLQKPSVTELGELMQHHLFLMDIGIWMLSDRAVELMVKRSYRNGKLSFYDMYSDFGLALGDSPRTEDPELNALTVVILPLEGGHFYHYGTSREMISSTLAIQNIVTDQREIMHRKAKPHPAMFIQNAIVETPLQAENSDLWIENSYVAGTWSLASKNIITGVPENRWPLRLTEGLCIDVVPVGKTELAARPYGFNDAFKGRLDDTAVMYQGRPVCEWLAQRGLNPMDIEGNHDLQAARLFPLCADADSLGAALRYMTTEPKLEEGKRVWQAARKMSADELSAYANLYRLTQQRDMFRLQNLPMLARHHEHSVFYQLNLNDVAQRYATHNLPLPEKLSPTVDGMTCIRDAMFRSRVLELQGRNGKAYEETAFNTMRDMLVREGCATKQAPRLSVYADQIVWGRSPARIDLAGGWTDTPPYSLMEGGNVVNIAIELNGQPPLQVYVKPCQEHHIVMRSIDLGAMEIVNTYEELAAFRKVGSPFAIPKAALILAGFHPDFCTEAFTTLEEQLKAFGSGIEITLLSAIPAGSGLGTSSILASTVLGAVNDFCGLNWDRYEVAGRTLVLEQLLTTGGGWQDQYGGILRGVKLLQTISGIHQQPLVHWLPGHVFTAPEYRKCHLLYYTGITRTAKNILSEIVKGMFLNETERLELLGSMKTHAMNMYDAIQRGSYEEMGRMVRHTWTQNCRLDAGSNPPAIQEITTLIDDLCLGYKLPGAGGGGYLYMTAKDEEAATRIRRILTQNAVNDRARFVEMSLSEKGMEVSRS